MLLLTVHLSINMSELKIKVNAKPLLILGEVTRTLIRGEFSSAVLTVNFENGVGQNIIKDTILFEEGTEGQENYSKVTINETKTLTGKLIYPIADVFVVQWHSMLKLYPKAKYEGWIF